MDSNPFQRIIQGIGVIAEISVLFYKAGYAFGDFQNKLADFPIGDL